MIWPHLFDDVSFDQWNPASGLSEGDMCAAVHTKGIMWGWMGSQVYGMGDNLRCNVESWGQCTVKILAQLFIEVGRETGLVTWQVKS